MHNTVVKINKKTGEVEIVYHPNQEGEIEALDLGKALSSRRGAHVYPKAPLKRKIFKTLRSLFGSDGKVADWTRRWRGKWILVPPKDRTFDRDFGTFNSHDEAVTAEVAALLKGDI